MSDSYRALFISDVHLSNRLPHSQPVPGTDVSDRLASQLEMMEGVSLRADMEGITDMYVLGDLFDKPVLDAVTLREVTRCLLNMVSGGKRLFIGAGNHESPTLRGGNYVSEYIQHISSENITYMDSNWNRRPVPWMQMWWVPWAPLGESKERIEDIQKEVYKSGDSPVNVLMLHHSVNGCTAGGWKCDDGLDPDWLTEDFDAVLSGHFHDPQEFGKCGMYLGSPLQLHFGDVGGQRVYWDITFKMGEDALCVPCETNLPRFHQYEVGGPEEINDRGDAKAGDYVRYIVVCAPEEWTKNRTAIAEAVKSLGTSYTAKAVHRPLPVGSVRLGSKTESMAYEELLAKYVEATMPEGLDRTWLAEIGNEALAAARAEADDED